MVVSLITLFVDQFFIWLFHLREIDDNLKGSFFDLYMGVKFALKFVFLFIISRDMFEPFCPTYRYFSINFHRIRRSQLHMLSNINWGTIEFLVNKILMSHKLWHSATKIIYYILTEHQAASYFFEVHFKWIARWTKDFTIRFI